MFVAHHSTKLHMYIWAKRNIVTFLTVRLFFILKEQDAWRKISLDLCKYALLDMAVIQ